MEGEALRERALQWISEDPDRETREELEGILQREDFEALRERFHGKLEFGTAGLRGLIGAGPNRMNRVVVIRTTAGLATYLLDELPDARKRGVVIGYDGRKLSRQASLDTAEVLAGHGIPVHIFPEVAPTPLTAFAVRHLGACAGVMVTASHNPAAYNGYKVYWENGAQIIPPHDKGISQAIEGLGPLASLPRAKEADARASGLWSDIQEEVVNAYLRSVRSHSVTADGKERLSIVYSAMHGVGGKLALRALREHDFPEVHVVAEQFEPDPEFPTVPFPNPEEEGALDLSLALAEEKGANLILANDPDADRLAVGVPLPEGGFRLLSGNEIGVLLTSYFLENGPRDDDRLVMTTIVSTPAAEALAKAHGARYDEVLTGFKWIANRAMELEASTGTRFVLGFEEALGYTIGDTCRDKDGVGAAVYFAELAAHLAAKGKTVLEELEGIWRRHGLHLSHQHSITLKGVEGKKKISSIMEALRASPPASIAGQRVSITRDYDKRVEVVLSTGEEKPLTLPRSNVLTYFLVDGSRLIARPSGTEPKIKFYIDVNIPVAADESLSMANQRGEEKIDDLLKGFLASVGI